MATLQAAALVLRLDRDQVVPLALVVSLLARGYARMVVSVTSQESVLVLMDGLGVFAAFRFALSVTHLVLVQETGTVCLIQTVYQVAPFVSALTDSLEPTAASRLRRIVTLHSNENSRSWSPLFGELIV